MLQLIKCSMVNNGWRLAPFFCVAPAAEKWS